MDDSDIPKFTSIDDILNRYLDDMPSAKSIGIYKTDGSLIGKKDRLKKIQNNYQNIAN